MKRSRILPAMGGAAFAALLAVGSFASAASASHGSLTPNTTSAHHAVAAHHVAPAKKHGNCYSNVNPKNDTGAADVSQNFESSFDQYDSAAAVAFTVAMPCFVDSVYVPGQYFNGSGPATSETVTFYTDNGGTPGSVIDSQTVTGVDAFGTFTIPITPVRIPAGNAWVSVVANMDFSAGGEWGWEVASTSKGHGDAMWENPGNGFASGCTTWTDIAVCIPGGGPSLMVQLVKQYQQ